MPLLGSCPSYRAGEGLPRRLSAHLLFALQGGPSVVLAGKEPLGTGLVFSCYFGFTWTGHPHLPEQGSEDLPQAPGM